MATLDDDSLREALVGLPGWRRESDAIVADYELESFPAVIALVDQIAERAEALDHHPDLDIRYRKLVVTLSTHSEGGVTAKDLDLAKIIDALAREAS
jgi:4a-hydroxytetrahydrobiopterin dehydratase